MDLVPVATHLAFGPVTTSFVVITGGMARVPTTGNTKIRLAVTAGSRNVVVLGTTVHVHGCGYEFEALITDRELQQGADLEALVGNHLSRMLTEVAPYMREHDPRIGKGYQDIAEWGSLLFDPPRRSDPAWVGSSQPNTARCPACDLAFSAQELPFWGGANLLWVHERCWIRIAVGAVQP